MSKKAVIYPRFALFWKDNAGHHHRYHSRRKKSVLMRADGLTEVETAHFRVQFGAGDLRNDSVVYKLPKERKQFFNDLRLFTAKDEISFQMKNL